MFKHFVKLLRSSYLDFTEYISSFLLLSFITVYIVIHLDIVQTEAEMFWLL